MKVGEKQYDTAKLAKYPFLREARQYVANMNVNLAEIETHPIYSQAIEGAKQRIRDRMEGRRPVLPAEKLGQELSILEYAIARILANHTGSRQIIQRFSAGEADSAYSFLLAEADRKAVAAELMQDLSFLPEGGRMHYTEYLKVACGLARQNPKWKLVNKAMDRGYVPVGEQEALILLREVIRLKISEPVETKAIPDSLKRAAAEIAAQYIRKPEEIKISQVNENAIPPCIKAMMASLESGSISHNERFIIATFYIGAGLNMEGLLKIFSAFPGYSEEKTRYQLEFLTGEKGATRYSCPSCAKIRTYGLCKSECGVSHPLSYFLKNRRKR